MTASTDFCTHCFAPSPARIRVAEPGWVVAECGCGLTRQITTDEAVTLQRAAMVKTATLPAAPPLGLPFHHREHGPERLRALAFDLWRRGAIDEEAYRRALYRTDLG